MGLLNYVYRFLGFESDDVKVSNKKRNKASYNLKASKSRPDEIDGIRVFYPERFEDCRDKVEMLKKGTPFFLDFRGTSVQERVKIFDYFDGVISVLDAKHEMVDKNLYIFLPKDMEIDRN